MSKRKLQPDELDRIGKTLLSRDAISEADIENIVSSPFLYSTVRNRMMSEAMETRSGFGLARYLVFAGSSMAVVFSVFIAVAFFRSEQKPVAVVEQPKMINITSYPNPDSIAAESKEPLPIDPLVEKVNTKRRLSQQSQTIDFRKPQVRSQRPQPAAPEVVFVPVTYTGDLSETVRGGRVVRVEMSRASLFAMGFNVPLENGSETVKADLLIGPDGVTRGVRLARDF